MKFARRKKFVNKLRSLPKLNIHEHYDCSVRHHTILDLWSTRNFSNGHGVFFPADVVELWNQAQELKKSRHEKRGNQLEQEAVERFKKYLSGYASQSLTQYIEAINTYIMPILQSTENLQRVAKERIEDAVADGIIALELRYAPQLSTMNGLTLDEVMDAVSEVTSSASIPVSLIVCALRHEQGDTFNQLADLAIKYRPRGVGGFDLAADEGKYPGVPIGWLESASRAQEVGIVPTIHLGEVNTITPDNIDRLNEFEVMRIGHGIRVVDPVEQVLEVCPSSNVVTGQCKSIADHPVDRLYRQGYRVTINTDGTTFTLSNLTDEYKLLVDNFGWEPEDFYAVNLTALEASSFSRQVKQKIRAQLIAGYSPKR